MKQNISDKILNKLGWAVRKISLKSAEQAGLSRATLEISSEFSDSFPLITYELHNLKFEEDPISSCWNIQLWYILSTSSFWGRLHFKHFILFWSPEHKIKMWGKSNQRLHQFRIWGRSCWDIKILILRLSSVLDFY